jgi:spectinomycin phosphotransferase
MVWLSWTGIMTPSLGGIAVEFGVSVQSATPVRGGQDSSATVWRGLLTDGSSVAIKVTRRTESRGLLVSRYLATRDVPGVVPPLLTRSGAPVAAIDDVQVSVQPWVSGRPAAAGGLSASQWRSFGKLLARLHGVELPAEMRAQVSTDAYAPVAVDSARRLQRYVSDGQPDVADDLAHSLIDAWRTASNRIAVLLDSVEQLATELRGRSRPGVLCHGDAHLANVLVDDDGKLWLLDWDEVVIAPRERDLMFVVDGVLADTPVTAEQQSWFFQGYGHHEIDGALLAYYRCDWALQDLTDFAERVLDPGRWPDDRREEALRFFRSLLWPTGIVELALAALRRA